MCDDITVNEVGMACGVSTRACEAATACRYRVEGREQVARDQQMAWQAMWAGVARGVDSSADVVVTVYEGGRVVNKTMTRAQYDAARLSQ